MTDNGKLYLVPTPIGNLGDITYRAVEVLKAVDTILAEDTRTSRKLLNRYGINKPLLPHHQFNEHRFTHQLVQRLKNGEQLALITDAGTPGISDPGYLLVRECLDDGIPVDCLPGPTAVIPALILSGLPADRFVFEGFLPVKKGRNKRLQSLKEETRTLVFYESPHRLVKFLNQLLAVFGPEHRASVSRELTKIHEETKRGTLAELLAHFEINPPKGEFVVVVEGVTKGAS